MQKKQRNGGTTSVMRTQKTASPESTRRRNVGQAKKVQDKMEMKDVSNVPRRHLYPAIHCMLVIGIHHVDGRGPNEAQRFHPAGLPPFTLGTSNFESDSDWS